MTRVFKALSKPLDDGRRSLIVLSFDENTTITQEGAVSVIRQKGKDTQHAVLESAEDIKCSIKNRPDSLYL